MDAIETMSIIRKTLIEQLELLAERSKNCDDELLDKITDSMVNLSKQILKT